MDCSPPDSFVHGISQARVLDWVAISFPGGRGGVFLTQGLNPHLLHLLHWQADSLLLSLQNGVEDKEKKGEEASLMSGKEFL